MSAMVNCSPTKSILYTHGQVHPNTPTNPSVLTEKQRLMRNAQRRDKYQRVKSVSIATSQLFSPFKNESNMASKILLAELQEARVNPQLQGIQQLVREQVSKETKDLRSALSNIMSAFKPGAAGRSHLVATALQGVTDRNFVAGVLGVSPGYARKCCAQEKNAGGTGVISTTHGRNGLEYTHIGVYEGRCLLSYVTTEANAKSGQKARTTGVTLYTEQSLYWFYTKYRIESFHLYLMEADMDPKYVQANWEPPDSVSEHDANCWHAVWRSRQPGFDLEDVYAEREQVCRLERLARGMADAKNVGRVRATASSRENFDPSTWTIMPRSMCTMFGFLAKINHLNAPSFGLSLKGLPETWRGIKILEKTDPKFCPVCETGIAFKLRLAKMKASYAEMDDNLERLELVGKIAKLEGKVAKYERHLVSLEKDREYISQLVRRARADHTIAILYMDFVSWHARCGDKIRDLALVLLCGKHRTPIHCITWGDGAGCDAHTVVDSLKHMFQHSSLLDGASELHFIHDNGPCFGALRTLYFTSLLHDLTLQWRSSRRNGLRVFTNFLTIYHGGCPSDGSGMCLKCAYNQWTLPSGCTGWPANGPQIIEMINGGYMSQHHSKAVHRVIGYYFAHINYGKAVFAAVDGNGIDKNRNIRVLGDIAQVKYSWEQDGVEKRLPGVICVRDVCGEGPWRFVDTLHSATSERGVMCCDCSNKRGYPVYHGDDACADDSGVDPADRTQPTDARFNNRDDMSKPTKKRLNKPKSQRIVDDSAPHTVSRLRSFLKARGLSTQGRREVLLQRAKAADGVKSSAGVGLNQADDKVMFCFSHCARPYTRAHAHAQCAHTHTHTHSHSQDEVGVDGSAGVGLEQADDEVVF